MRIKNHPNENEKALFLRAQHYLKYISWIPGLKMVAVCDSLSMYATKTPEEAKKLKWTQGSDIDLFIITAPNRLWYVRVVVTIIFQLLWVRRHWDKVKDRFCLSFFITENAMDFSKISIEKDIYLFYWIYFLKPIINKDQTYEKFIKANVTMWINNLSLHWDNKAYLIKTWSYIHLLDKCRLLNFKNWVLKKIFLSKTLKHKKRLWDPVGIIVNNDMLKFHDNDRRMEIRGLIIR